MEDMKTQPSRNSMEGMIYNGTCVCVCVCVCVVVLYELGSRVRRPTHTCSSLFELYMTQ